MQQVRDLASPQAHIPRSDRAGTGHRFFEAAVLQTCRLRYGASRAARSLVSGNRHRLLYKPVPAFWSMVTVTGFSVNLPVTVRGQQGCPFSGQWSGHRLLYKPAGYSTGPAGLPVLCSMVTATGCSQASIIGLPSHGESRQSALRAKKERRKKEEVVYGFTTKKKKVEKVSQDF